jgi:hypothetical protein
LLVVVGAAVVEDEILRLSKQDPAGRIWKKGYAVHPANARLK